MCTGSSDHSRSDSPHTPSFPLHTLGEHQVQLPLSVCMCVYDHVFVCVVCVCVCVWSMCVECVCVQGEGRMCGMHDIYTYIEGQSTSAVH